jgi:haloacid dehalogenase superfamily, subfamily IA, variant 3 with third motif having DD or ED/haloacid dehalogenase superfamily, subfamily IA, variant 1 with third motif having Dx(3-4)D or Dx(3-4)E
MADLAVALFDFDGVIVDTEPIYDKFWNEASVRFNIGIDDFAYKIKGSTLATILNTYFKDFPEDVVQQVKNESIAYESAMDLPPMPGSIEFLKMLHSNGVRMAIVTSSDESKIKRAFQLLNIEYLFETIVCADRITKGKPDPMCYLLAASDLGVSPEDCLVFEDSYYGIQSGTDAGMRVIGLSTTNPAETLVDKVHTVIPDFRNSTFDDYLNWSKK